MDKRMKKLLKELNIPESAVSYRSAKDAVKSVNRKLDAQTPERARYRVRRLIRAAAVAVAALLALAATAVAVGTRLDLFGWLFGDTTSIAPYIYVPEEELSDGRFLCRVEQAVATPREAMVTLSVRALTPEAQEILDDPARRWELFYTVDYLDPDPELQSGDSWSGSAQVVEEDGRNVVYAVKYSEDLNDPELAPLAADFTFLELPPEQRKIVIPVRDDVKTYELNLTDSEGRVKINLSPMSFQIRKNYIPEFNSAYCLDVCFRMRDGGIRTVNEFFSRNDRTVVSLDNMGEKDFTVTVMAKEILNMDDVRGLIYKGVEYELENPANSRNVKVPRELEPFKAKLSNTDTHFPAGEYFERLKARYRLRGKTLTVKYRGAEYRLSEGSSLAVSGDGEEVELWDAPYVDEDGRFMIPLEFLYECLSVYTDPIDPDWEAGSSGPSYGECWIVP